MQGRRRGPGGGHDRELALLRKTAQGTGTLGEQLRYLKTAQADADILLAFFDKDENLLEARRVLGERKQALLKGRWPFNDNRKTGGYHCPGGGYSRGGSDWTPPEPTKLADGAVDVSRDQYADGSWVSVAVPLPGRHGGCMSDGTSTVSDAALGHFVLRAMLGVNMAVHGLSRVGDPAAFANGLVTAFASTPLPSWSVRAFALVLPFVELTVGLGLLVGWHLRVFLLLGGLTLVSLTFGTCLRQDWNSAGLQLIYGFAFAWLLRHAADARFCVDSWRARRDSR